MKYRLLGNSGLRRAEMSLGTMTFGEDWGWGSRKDEARQIYEAYRAAGGNFIDTANVYTNGTSEVLVGEFIHGHRQEVVLATKYTNAAPGNDPNASSCAPSMIWFVKGRCFTSESRMRRHGGLLRPTRLPICAAEQNSLDCRLNTRWLSARWRGN